MDILKMNAIFPTWKCSERWNVEISQSTNPFLAWNVLMSMLGLIKSKHPLLLQVSNHLCIGSKMWFESNLNKFSIMWTGIVISFFQQNRNLKKFLTKLQSQWQLQSCLINCFRTKQWAIFYDLSLSYATRRIRQLSNHY